jgi:hypothetical protein
MALGQHIQASSDSMEYINQLIDVQKQFPSHAVPCVDLVSHRPMTSVRHAARANCLLSRMPPVRSITVGFLQRLIRSPLTGGKIMALTVKKITLWRGEVANKPGTLGKVLGPLACAGADLQVVMGYHYHGAGDKAVVEVYPVSGKKATAAAKGAGLGASAIPTLLVEGENKTGLGAAISQAIAGAGINIGFLVAQVIGTKFSAVIGFRDEAASRKAAALIKKAARSVPK